MAMIGLLLALAAGQDPGEKALRTLETSDDAAELEKAAAELRALDVPAEAREKLRADAAAAIRAGRERRLKALEARVLALEPVAKLRELKAELHKRREAALKLILDKAAYLPEAHADFRKGDAANGQAAVDALVLAKHPGSVQELWASTPSVPVDAALRAEAREIADAAAKALALFGEAERDVLPPALAAEKLDLRNFALDARDAEIHAWNRKVDRYNEALADPDVGGPEKEHAAVINEYREMMGRRRLFLDARLCRSSKKHSAACNEAQKIWHAGADGDPQTRARLESFPNPVAENVAIAFAHPADLWWRGWFRASDHHRNAVSDSWTCMGYGYVGNVGTQTFSTLPPPRALK